MTTCKDCNGSPKKLQLSDLISTQIGEPYYAGGCGRGKYATLDCISQGFEWPQNGEFALGLSNTGPANAPTCVVCYDQPGCDCSCSTNKSNTPGFVCGVVRQSFKGHIGSCALKFASSMPNSSLTGIQQSDPASGMWNNFDASTYTCPQIRPYDPSVVGGVMDLCVNQNYTILKDKWKKGGECWNWVIQGSANQQITGPVLSGTLERFLELYGGVDLSVYEGQANKDSTDFLSGVLSACQANPAACEPYLNALCRVHSKKNPKPMTRNDVFRASSTLNTNNSNIVSACGCHLPPDEYSTQATLGIDEKSTNACDPICKLPGAIPKQNCSSGVCTPATCSQNVCVIDNVSVNSVNSNIGNINFEVVCGGCDSKNGGCLCLFQNSNVFSQASSIGNIDFSVKCGGNCAIIDPKTGKQTKVQCPSKPTDSGIVDMLWDWRIEIGLGLGVVIVLMMMMDDE